MKTISILILMIGFQAHAGGTADAVRATGDAVRAGTRAGKVAQDASAAAASLTRAIKATVGMVLEQTKPQDAGAFRAELNQVQGLDAQAITELVKAYEVNFINKGCVDAKLTADAYKNLEKAIHRAVADLIARGSNVLAEAELARKSDFNGDGITSPEEKAISDANEFALQGQVDMAVIDFAKQMHKTGEETVASFGHLGTRCGLASEVAVRARASVVH